MKKIILNVGNVLLVIMAIVVVVNVLAGSIIIAYAASDPKELINEYFSYMGHDWNNLADLYSEEDREGVRQFLLNEEFAVNNIGVLNVNNAEVTEIVEVNYQDVKDCFDNDYDKDSVRTFVVGVDYSVNDDSIFFSNGLVYNVMLLIQESNGLKVKEIQQIAYPEKLLEEGYVFADEYENTVEMMNARLDGILMNGNGEVFDIIGDQIMIRDNNIKSKSTIAKTKHNIPTADTLICVGKVICGVPFYVNISGEETPYHAQIPFFDYCLGVVAGEAEYDYLNGEARKAIAVAIKTFTWHHMIKNNNSFYGINLKPDLQAYKPSRINAKIRLDFNRVKNVWMESEEGYIFEAHYYKGKDELVKQHYGKSGGALYQDGCYYLYKDYKMNYKNMLRYYYNDSIINKGEGQRECHVGKVCFFDSNKKCYK